MRIYCWSQRYTVGLKTIKCKQFTFCTRKLLNRTFSYADLNNSWFYKFSPSSHCTFVIYSIFMKYEILKMLRVNITTIEKKKQTKNKHICLKLECSNVRIQPSFYKCPHFSSWIVASRHSSASCIMSNLTLPLALL